MTSSDAPLDNEEQAPLPGDGESAPGEAGPAPEDSAPGSGEEGAIDMSSFEEQVEDSDLAEAHARIASLDEDLARARADLYNLNQEYGNYVRRAKEAASTHRESGRTDVLEALVGVLDDIAAARAAGDLADGPFASIATKLEETLSSRFSLVRFGEPGEDFDPARHEALMASTSSEVDHPVVAQVLQPGYLHGERVLRAAKVMVTNPE